MRKAWIVGAVLSIAACGGETTASVEPEPAASAAPEPAPASESDSESESASESEPEPESERETTQQPEAGSAQAEAGAGGGDAFAESLVQPDPELFRDVIRRVVRIPSDRALQRRARASGMRFVNLTWEDTGRSFGSAVGPNISDLTLEVIERREGRRSPRTSLLPVLRYPNFTDRTADLPADRFVVRVGNEREGGELRTVALRDVLAHLRDYLSSPDDFRATSDDFTAPRDTHYLVSAQHVFVPVPPGTRVEFAPVLFNYQSSEDAPAVLCLVVTREGTSIQIIENRYDPTMPGGWGQRLYFNHAGQRTTFTAERRSDVAARVEAGEARADDATALDEGADMVAIVQVPLHVPMAPRRAASGGGGLGDLGVMGHGAGAGSGSGYGAGASDVERAVVGHGLDEGPMVETRRRRIRRDPRFPIRVTIQFYRATSNGVVSDDDLAGAVAQIERVYADADYVGSLVVGSRARPTAHHVEE